MRKSEDRKGRHIGIIAAAAVLFLAHDSIGANTARFAWSPSEDSVAGYRIHYGVVSRTYNQVFDAGNATNATVSNLTPATRYYFALTAYNGFGVESDYSTELTYFVPTNSAPPISFGLRINLTPTKQTVLTLTGATNRTYSIEATTNLVVWTNIGAVAVGPSGSSAFTDTNATQYARRFYRARAL